MTPWKNLLCGEFLLHYSCCSTLWPQVFRSNHHSSCQQTYTFIKTPKTLNARKAHIHQKIFTDLLTSCKERILNSVNYFKYQSWNFSWAEIHFARYCETTPSSFILASSRMMAFYHDNFSSCLQLLNCYPAFQGAENTKHAHRTLIFWNIRVFTIQHGFMSQWLKALIQVVNNWKSFIFASLWNTVFQI